MLRSLFEWLDFHPSAYWGTAALATLALISWVAAGWRAGRTPRPQRREWLYSLLLFIFLIAWRWPYLFGANEYNPDESQLIAGAMTLWHDPAPWRSLDVATSGPLNYYALFPLHLLGLPFDYFAARLTALLLIWGSLVACRRLFRSAGTAEAADLAVLPATVFFAAASERDLVHYSSEHLPLFLTALAAAWLFGPDPGFAPMRRIVAAGLIAGLLPWAKLQAAPLMVVLVGARLGQLLIAKGLPPARRWREAGYLLTGAALPAGLAVITLATTGQLEVFWHSYLLANVDYVRDAPALGSLLGQFLELSRERGHLYVYWLSALFSLCLGLGAYALARQRPGRLFVLGAIGFACSVTCVLTPQRPLLHYVLLTVIPLTWWTGAAIVECGLGLRTARWAIPLLFALGALCPLAGRWRQEDPDELGRLAEDWRHPRSAIGSLIRAHSTPDDSLAVWGWWPALYVDAGLRQATHDGNTSWSMPLAPVSQRGYYQARYVEDLAVNHPLFFVDAVGPGAPFFNDRSLSGHENVPALANHIREHYRLWFDAGPARIYLRRDVARPPVPTAAALAELNRQARRDSGLDAFHPVSILPADAPHWTVRGLPAQMMLPETRMDWRLDGSERAVLLDYGFHPKAVAEGKTNGAVLVVELQTGSHAPRLLFRRVLDPQHVTADRRPLTTRLTLPPFGPDAKLILRTEPGENGDASWDWVYLQRLGFLRSPGFSRRQFPGFSRAPNSAAGDQIMLIDGADGRYLSIHAPGALHFLLNGKEQSLQFDYGLEPGAYTKGGQTDGAIFLVELQRATGGTEVLFEKRLRPAGEPADRGRQHAQVAIPNIRAGDGLDVRIAPGESDSWDWTYLANLALH